MSLFSRNYRATTYWGQSGPLVLLWTLIVCLSPNSCSWDNAPQQDISRKFNVIMIVADALRQDVLGCYGGEAKTPNIDWLAAQGVVFDHAYSTSPWTVPSSVAMFTGNYPTTYPNKPFVKKPGATPLLEQSIQISIPNTEELLVESLKKLGYATVMKVENPNARRHNNMQGFVKLPDLDSFDGAISPESQVAIKNIIQEELLQVQTYRQTYIFLEYLRTISSESNFFALYWMEDPHAPYEPIDKFQRRVVVDEALLKKEKKVYATTLPEGMDWSKEEREYNKNLYLAEVESVDERIGFIVKMLQHRGLFENTVILFTSDHGEQFGEHNQYGHGGFGRGCNYYQQLIRVPLIIVVPDLAKNIRIKTPVSHVSLMPTIKDLLGVHSQDSMQGESYFAMMQDRPGTMAPVFFSDVRDNEQVDGMVEGVFKLIALKNGHFSLYDLNADREELHDIALQRPDLVQSMSNKLKEMRDSNSKRLQKNLQQLDLTGEQPAEDEQQNINKLKELGYLK